MNSVGALHKHAPCHRRVVVAVEVLDGACCEGHFASFHNSRLILDAECNPVPVCVRTLLLLIVLVQQLAINVYLGIGIYVGEIHVAKIIK